MDPAPTLPHADPAALAARAAGAPDPLAVLREDQVARWTGGDRPPAEEYLRLVPGLSDEDALVLIMGEVALRRERGEAADLAEYQARFPRLADDLAAQFGLADQLPTGAPTTSLSGVPGTACAAAEAPPGYEFVRELGRGGFGTVWLARNAALDKLVAVKHLRTGGDALVREARTMAALKVHPNRVAVFDLVETPAGRFLVMDYVDGGPLSRLVGPGRPLDPVRAARYVAGVADGLAEVHASGIVHRDIKPDNILLDTARDVPLLTDFGLAGRSAGGPGVCGTPGYMAPELFDGTASAKTDVFALAATLFHLVTGRKPFESRRLLDHEREVRAGVNPDELRGLPAGLAEVIRAGLDPDPDRRPDLALFTALLRGCHTRELAQRLHALAAPAARTARLDVTVWTASETDLVFRPVFRGPADGVAAVRCEPVVRFEVTADADGYLTVLILGSSGEVGVLFPNPRAPDNRVRAGRPQWLTLKLTPPAGTDHAVLVWTPGPCHLSAEEWREQIESGRLVPPADRGRGVEFVDHVAPDDAAGSWAAAVVGMEHGG